MKAVVTFLYGVGWGVCGTLAAFGPPPPLWNGWLALGLMGFGLAWLTFDEWYEDRKRRKDDFAGWVADGMARQVEEDMRRFR